MRKSGSHNLCDYDTLSYATGFNQRWWTTTCSSRPTPGNDLIISSIILLTAHRRESSTPQRRPSRHLTWKKSLRKVKFIRIRSPVHRWMFKTWLTFLQVTPPTSNCGSTCLSPVHWLAQNLTVLGGLTKVTATRARRPGGPLGHLAIHWMLRHFCHRLHFLLGRILTRLQAVIPVHKVVPISTASTVGEGLALAILCVIREPHETTSTWSSFHCLLADLLCVSSREEALGTFCALLLFVHHNPVFTFRFLLGLSREQSSPDAHAWTTSGAAWTPVTPWRSWTHGVRCDDVSDQALGLHALLLLHDHNMGTLLATHVVHECPGAHRYSDTARRGTLGPRRPPWGLANTHTFTAIVHSRWESANVFRVIIILVTGCPGWAHKTIEGISKVRHGDWPSLTRIRQSQPRTSPWRSTVGCN